MKKVSITASVRAEVAARFLSNKATKADEVILALFQETAEQRQTILALNLKVSMLESAHTPAEVFSQLKYIMYKTCEKADG